MNVRDLTRLEIAELLVAAYLADQGEPVEGPSPSLLAELADRWGGDADLGEDVRYAWRYELDLTGRNIDEAEYWLDVDFMQTCPEDWPTEG